MDWSGTQVKKIQSLATLRSNQLVLGSNWFRGRCAEAVLHRERDHPRLLPDEAHEVAEREDEAAADGLAQYDEYKVVLLII